MSQRVRSPQRVRQPQATSSAPPVVGLDTHTLPSATTASLCSPEEAFKLGSGLSTSSGSASGRRRITGIAEPEPAISARDAPSGRVGNRHHFRPSPVERLTARSSASSPSWSDDADDSSYNESGSESVSVVSQSNSQPRTPDIPSPTASFHSGGSDADSEPDSTSSETDRGGRHHGRAAPSGAARSERFSSTAGGPDLTIEDVDPRDSRWRNLQVLLPTEVESSRSRSGSKHRQKELERGVMHRMSNLCCDSDASRAGANPAEDGFLRRQRELKHIRRTSMSSTLAKRCHDEMGDLGHSNSGLDMGQAGSGARSHKRLCRSSLRRVEDALDASSLIRSQLEESKQGRDDMKMD